MDAELDIFHGIDRIVSDLLKYIVLRLNFAGKLLTEPTCSSKALIPSPLSPYARKY